MSKGHLKWAKLLEADPRFTPESFSFVRDALDLAIQLSMSAERAKFLANEEASHRRERDGHITGREFCDFIVDYAVDRFGFMAKEVLYQLGIRKTDDIGDIVNLLADFGYVSRSEDDHPDDFNNVFDLAAELKRRFRFTYKDAK